MRVSLLLFLLLIFGLISCKKEKCDSTKPIISFDNFITFADTGNGFNTAKLTILFEDCNGDVGLDDDNLEPPFDTASQYYYNLKLEYFELQNGKWVQLEDLEPPFYYRIPDLTPEGRTKNLEGTIEVSLEPTYYLPFSNYDTLKYSIQLFDRELNGSNIIETPEIIRPDF